MRVKVHTSGTDAGSIGVSRDRHDPVRIADIDKFKSLLMRGIEAAGHSAYPGHSGDALVYIDGQPVVNENPALLLAKWNNSGFLTLHMVN